MNFNLKQKLFVHTIILSLIYILFAFTPTEAKEVRGVTSDTILLGVIADMTGPTATDISAPLVAALRTYYSSVNDDGGINGRKIRLLVEDDRYSIPLSFAAFKKLVFRSKIFALLGPMSSGSALSLIGQIQKEKVPNICWGLSKKMTIPTKRYIFAVLGNYEDCVKIMFEYIFDIKKVKASATAFVYPDVEAGKLGFRAAVEESKRFNVKLHAEVLNLGALDATSQVLNLKRAKIKNILVHETPAAAAVLLRSAKKMGLDADFYGTGLATNEDLLELAGSSAEGFVGDNSHNSWYQEGCSGCAEMEVAMIKRYKKVTYNTKLFSMGWVGAMVLAEGIKKAGRDLDREGLVNSLDGIKDFDPKNICGPISYSPKDHSGPMYRRLFKTDVKKKRFVGITDWIKSPQ